MAPSLRFRRASPARQAPLSAPICGIAARFQRAHRDRRHVGTTPARRRRRLRPRTGPRDGGATAPMATPCSHGSWADAIVWDRQNWHIERVVRAREQDVSPGSSAGCRLGRQHSASTYCTRRTTHCRCATVRAAASSPSTTSTFFRIPDRYPLVRRLYFQWLTRLSARVADAIIVPSRAVRDDVRRLLRIDNSHIHVVPEAAGEPYRPIVPDEAMAVARGYGLDAPYVLSVGSLRPGKNRARLIRAFARLGRGCRSPARDRRPAGVEVRGRLRLLDELGMGDRVIILATCRPRPPRAVQRRRRLRAPVAVRGVRPARTRSDGVRRTRAHVETSPPPPRSPAMRRCSSIRCRSTTSPTACDVFSPTRPSVPDFSRRGIARAAAFQLAARRRRDARGLRARRGASAGA